MTTSCFAPSRHASLVRRMWGLVELAWVGGTLREKAESLKAEKRTGTIKIRIKIMRRGPGRNRFQGWETLEWLTQGSDGKRQTVATLG